MAEREDVENNDSQESKNSEEERPDASAVQPIERLELAETTTEETLDQDRARRNRLLNAWYKFQIDSLSVAQFCLATIALFATVAVVAVIAAATLDHTFTPQLLDDTQVMAIHDLAAGFKDTLSGSAIASTIFLIWRLNSERNRT